MTLSRKSSVRSRSTKVKLIGVGDYLEVQQTFFEGEWEKESIIEKMSLKLLLPSAMFAAVLL